MPRSCALQLCLAAPRAGAWAPQPGPAQGRLRAAPFPVAGVGRGQASQEGAPQGAQAHRERGSPDRLPAGGLSWEPLRPHVHTGTHCCALAAAAAAPLRARVPGLSEALEVLASVAAAPRV